jgi:hypothetical protein
LSDRHSRTDAVAIALGADQFDGKPSVRDAALVVPELRIRAKNEDDNIETPVAVEICNTAAAMRGLDTGQTGFRAHVPKVPLSIVQPQAVRLIPSARSADAIVGVGVGGEDVFPTIVVHVNDRCAPAR